MLTLDLVYVRGIPSYTGYHNSGTLPQRMSLLEPKAAAALTRVIADSQGLITFTDVYRSTLTQIDAIRSAAAAKKRLYAPPTKSGHQFGMSVDIAIAESLTRLRASTVPSLKAAGKSRDALAMWLKPYGWSGISNETWHFDFLAGHRLVTERIQAEHGAGFTLDDLETQRALNIVRERGVIGMSVPLAVDGVFGKGTLKAIAAARERFELGAGGDDHWFRRVLAGVAVTVNIT